jgi:hypothetical protein
MIRRIAFIAVLVALTAPLTCPAQDQGYWRAASTTANSITGDITVSPTKVVIDFYAFPMVQARTLTPAEAAAVFDADVNAGVGGRLYHVTVPADKRFLRHNTLCGTEQTEWMVTFVSGGQLQVAFFSGAQAPVFTFDALRNSTDLCATFTYAR